MGQLRPEAFSRKGCDKVSNLTYKCPSCAAPLEFDGRAEMMTCGNCGNSFEPETVAAVNQIERETSRPNEMNWEMHDQPVTQEDRSQTQSYQCSSCGAELYMEETTVATACAFCGSPSVIPTQFTEDTRPSRIIPFKIEKDQAEAMFRDYFKGRKLLPNLFLKSTNRIEEIRKLYVPYWVFSGKADARMSYKATTVSTHRSGNYRVTTTRHFLVHRAGTLDFDNLPVDASSKLDNKITESLEPFKPNQAITFEPHTLSGAQANRADVDKNESQTRANERVSVSTDAAFRSTVRGYASVIPQDRNIRIKDGMSDSVLYPIWIITTVKNGTTYTFAINGQTGDITSDIPWSKAKFLGRMFGLGLGLAALGIAAVYILTSMGVLK